MKKFLAFVSLILFVSIFIGLLPVSVSADESGNNAAIDIPESSFYNVNEALAEIENSRSFSEEIPYVDTNDQYHSQAMTQNSGGISTFAMPISDTKVPNGVYAFRNLGNTDRWLDVQGDITDPGFHMQQYAYGTSPADMESESGLYIVKAVDSTRYTIRLLLEPSLTFGISGTEVLTKTIPLDDDDVEIEDTFYIYRNGNGYTVRPYGSSNYICPNDTDASGAAGAPDSYLTSKSLTEAGDHARWALEKHYGHIVDGIYAFKNVGNTDRWMDIEQDHDRPGYHMQQYAFDGSSPADTFTRSGLYKVTQIGDTGRYVIRSMLNNRMSFSPNLNGVITKEIPYDDATVFEDDTYYIEYDSTYGGYTIRPYNMTHYIVANNTQASGMSGAPDSYLTTSGTKNANAVWEMEPCTEMQQWGGSVYFELEDFDTYNKLIAGKITLMKIITWSCDLKANQSYASIDPIYSQYASVDWGNSTSTLLVSSHDEGNITINISVKKNDSIIGTTQQSFYVHLPIPEGQCIIRNREIGNYLQLDDNAAPDYESGSILELGDFTGADYELWELEHYWDGYYFIESVESGLYMTVPFDKEDTANAPIIQFGYNLLDTQLWKFDPKMNGNYVIRQKTAEYYDAEWCLSASSTNNRQPVQQREYVNDSDYADEWLVKHINGSINLNVMYDGGYIARYSNAVTRINTELMTLKQKYISEFGILVNYNTPTQFISYGDECPNKPNGKCACTTDENCYDSTSKSNLMQYHHTNFTNILLRIPYPDMTQSFTIAYIGYDTCGRNEHESFSHYGLAYSSRGLIGVANHLDGTEQNVQETKTLVHEVGHMYGAIDHYDTKEDDDNVKTTQYLNILSGTNLYSDNCIYGRDKNDVASTLTLCEGCRRDIEANAADFNHN